MLRVLPLFMRVFLWAFCRGIPLRSKGMGYPAKSAVFSHPFGLRPKGGHKGKMQHVMLAAEFEGFFGDGEGAVFADVVQEADGDEIDHQA